jgi:hypothetical protein
LGFKPFEVHFEVQKMLQRGNFPLQMFFILLGTPYNSYTVVYRRSLLEIERPVGIAS